MFTYHYCDLKPSHSGDFQQYPGPVSSELQGHAFSAASVLASVMSRGLKIGEWNMHSLNNQIEQMREVIDARGHNIHIIGITETLLTNSHTNFEIAIYKDLVLKDTIWLRAMEVYLRYTFMRVFHTSFVMMWIQRHWMNLLFRCHPHMINTCRLPV